MLIKLLILYSSYAASPFQTPPTAIVPLNSLFNQEDYPHEALVNGQAGTVFYELVVATDGSVSACKIRTSSGSPSLDDTTCTLLQRRARFTPGRDADGTPIVGSFKGRMVWHIGERNPMAALNIVLDSKIHGLPECPNNAGNAMAGMNMSCSQQPPMGLKGPQPDRK